MTLHDDSLTAVVVIPVISGVVGFLILGPFGFFLGMAVPLIIGTNIQTPEKSKDDRIAELERRVEELEDESAE